MNKILLLLSLLPLLVACESKTIKGRIVDPLGQPIEGVAVSVEKTTFSATTNANGEYQLDYAPGVALNVRWQKEDNERIYEPLETKLSITEKCAYPMPEQMMWCCPNTPDPQLYLLGETTFEVIPAMPMEQAKTWNYIRVSRTARYLLPNVSWTSWSRFQGDEEHVGAIAIKQITRPTRGGRNPERLALNRIHQGAEFNAFELKEDDAIVVGDTIILVAHIQGVEVLYYGLQIAD